MMSSAFLAKNMVGKEPRRDDPDKVTGRLSASPTTVSLVHAEAVNIS
jgi:hypothetical protein